ncbi:TfoX/Sxy family protein [Thermodesulfobacteriota bacterium]
MAYDKGLAQRVREILEDQDGYVEKTMFGGVCFLLHGNMACGILNDDIIVRVGPENYESCLQQPYTRKFDITGRPMKGWVMVDPEGHESDEDLSLWLGKGVTFALSLPPNNQASARS